MTLPFGNVGVPIVAVLGGANNISVTRYQPGSYVNGRWVQGASSTFFVSASVQPSSPKDIRQLPEGERTSEAITIFSQTLLHTSDVQAGLESDVVTHSGRAWKVMLVEDWITQAGYSRAVAVRIGD